MNAILTSDWQVDFYNLDLCRRVADQMLTYAREKNIKTIINAGDMKEAYNPVDMRVVKFWVWFIKRARDKDISVVLLLGNHDRLSQSVDSMHWLDVLRAAGAVVVSQPHVKMIDGARVGFLPYTADKRKEKQWAKTLRQDIADIGKTQDPSVLIFHTEVAGAYLNALGVTMKGNTAEDIYLDQYDAAFGGHIHLHQQITERSYYIGSPFCQDWSEVNTLHGFVHTGRTPKGKIGWQWIKSVVPDWYDEEFLVKRRKACKSCGGSGIVGGNRRAASFGMSCSECSPEPGAYIRLKVEVTSKKISAQLHAEETNLKTYYRDIPNLRFHVVPVIRADEKTEVVLAGATDLEIVKSYVGKTFPDAATYSFDRVVGYLSTKLGKIDPGARLHRLRYISVAATNVLCFPKVAVNYRKQGLILLKGENLDWRRRSNGAGKTSLLSLLPVALFGRTMKGQTNDAWATETNENKASVTLTVKDARGRKIEITRMRRPHKLWMHINGEDVSTGLTGKGRLETQGQIEDTLGIDMRMLENSVYIDQTVANGFVFGTLKSRMDLVSKIQNLERYETAGKSVVVDIKKVQAALQEVMSQQDVLDSEVASLQAQLEEQADPPESQDWQKKLDGLTFLAQSLTKSLREHVQRRGLYEQEQVKATRYGQQAVKHEDRAEKLDVAYAIALREFRVAEELVQDGKCDKCGQDTDSLVLTLDEQRANVKRLKSRRTNRQKRAEVARTRLEKALSKITEYEEELQEIKRDTDEVARELSTVRQAAREEKIRNRKRRNVRLTINTELARAKRIRKACRVRLKDLTIKGDMLVYASKAFHRSGIPMYLAAACTPVLNKSAEEYSELLTGGAIQVRFEVVEGDFEVSILNRHGSSNNDGQSVGERAMAGLIAAFAVREICPRSNLLVLDEPGHGLDSEGAKQFAKGLIEIAKRWETVIVTTHSPVVSSILEGQAKTWVVQKKKGRSELVVE